ncbi:MAG: hypothetical protein ACOCUT_00145 [bacterium]
MIIVKDLVTMKLAKKDENYFWIRDDGKSQFFSTEQEAYNTLKSHKVRWKIG